MTQTLPDSTSDAPLAGLYGLLSTVLADPPDRDAVETLRSDPIPDALRAPNPAFRRGLKLFSEWQSDGADDTAVQSLEYEHTRLFVGPRPALQIHESFYEDDFLGAPLAAVNATYDRLGIEPAEDLREEPDHAAVELAALRVLADDPDARAKFLDEHGHWFATLGEDIRRETDNRFYEAVGWLVEGVVEFDQALLSGEP